MARSGHKHGIHGIQLKCTSIQISFSYWICSCLTPKSAVGWINRNLAKKSKLQWPRKSRNYRLQNSRRSRRKLAKIPLSLPGPEYRSALGSLIYNEMTARIGNWNRNFWSTSRRSRLLGDCPLGMLSSLKTDFNRHKTFLSLIELSCSPSAHFSESSRSVNNNNKKKKKKQDFDSLNKCAVKEPSKFPLMNQFGDRKVRQNSVRFHAKGGSANRPNFGIIVISKATRLRDERISKAPVRHHRHRGKFQTSNPRENGLTQTDGSLITITFGTMPCDWNFTCRGRGPRQATSNWRWGAATSGLAVAVTFPLQVIQSIAWNWRRWWWRRWIWRRH